MRFNPRARLDRGQVSDRRGRAGPGFPVGGRRGGIRIGGGIGGILVLLVIVLVFGGNVLDGGTVGPAGEPQAGSGLQSCRTGADANRRQDCALLADVNSIQAFWHRALPRQAGVGYTAARTELFSGQVRTGCGVADSGVGPFYCPVDDTVYLDPSFFREMLQGRLGARGGKFSWAYVLAHEYGHHVQDLLGTMGRVRTQRGPDSDAVRLELQADCYAGIWTGSVRHAQGRSLVVGLTPRDVADALDAARAVGDDRIQQRTTGDVDPDQWTHGSAAERMRWFRTGLRHGTLGACDTFAARRL